MLKIRAARKTEIERLQAEVKRLIALVDDERAMRIDYYEGYLEEQKRAILELGERLKLNEGECRYYSDRTETSEQLRATIVEVLNLALTKQLATKDITPGVTAANTLVNRIANPGV